MSDNTNAGAQPFAATPPMGQAIPDVQHEPYEWGDIRPPLPRGLTGRHGIPLKGAYPWTNPPSERGSSGSKPS